MTTRFNQPSLRPAPAIPDLPPGLQPHAVLALAPPTDRRRSAAMSAGVYAVLAGGLAWLAHAGTVAVLHPPATHGTFTLSEQPPSAPSTQTRPSAAVPKTPTVPVIAKVTPPSDTIPDTPAAMPAENHASDAPTTPTEPTAPLGTSTDSGPVSLSSDAVRVLHQVNPQYPPLAIAARLQGQVVVRMVVDEQGVPIQAEAVSGPEVFKGPAMRAAQQWRFAPAMTEGRAVPATFLLTLNFVLR
ncbi:MAG: TonB family protein [Acidobacteria bacterium]|nr:TonB family protein [Acidobacteriota bacterium]